MNDVLSQDVVRACAADPIVVSVIAEIEEDSRDAYLKSVPDKRGDPEASLAVTNFLTNQLKGDNGD